MKMYCIFLTAALNSGTRVNTTTTSTSTSSSVPPPATSSGTGPASQPSSQLNPLEMFSHLLGGNVSSTRTASSPVVVTAAQVRMNGNLISAKYFFFFF